MSRRYPSLSYPTLHRQLAEMFHIDHLLGIKYPEKSKCFPLARRLHEFRIFLFFFVTDQNLCRHTELQRRLLLTDVICKYAVERRPQSGTLEDADVFGQRPADGIFYIIQIVSEADTMDVTPQISREPGPVDFMSL